MKIRIFIFILWCLSWLPFRVCSFLGRILGAVLYHLLGRRRRIGEINLRLCFPNLSEAERTRLLKENFVAMSQMILEYGYCWFTSEQRFRKIVQVTGLEHLKNAQGRPVILQMPHFTGLDLAGLRLSLETPVVSIYAKQKDPWLDNFFRSKRLRFKSGEVFSRQAGIRQSIKAMKKGMSLYYLPDQDHGPLDSVFVNFFGIPASTLTGPSRLASMMDAVVLPCYPRRTRNGYVVVIEPPMPDFPSGNLQTDARHMNAVIERQVMKIPHQYFWLHKRFKTRPQGESDVYAKPVPITGKTVGTAS
ncbi:MAG: lipid A biosynthesis acyltransferase [Burkholderiaceae bacterium]|nr:lipid A biosynthesis acyltransferase [Burkholderiaceae bacterium]